jgi:hypothetical protein
MGCVKEPNGCVDANAETPKVGRISLESVDDGEVGKRSQFSRGSKDLEVLE